MPFSQTHIDHYIRVSFETENKKFQTILFTSHSVFNLQFLLNCESLVFHEYISHWTNNPTVFEVFLDTNGTTSLSSESYILGPGYTSNVWWMIHAPSWYGVQLEASFETGYYAGGSLTIGCGSKTGVNVIDKFSIGRSGSTSTSNYYLLRSSTVWLNLEWHTAMNLYVGISIQASAIKDIGIGE